MKIQAEYLVIFKSALKYLMGFSTKCFCEHAFSALLLFGKKKYSNKLHVKSDLWLMVKINQFYPIIYAFIGARNFTDYEAMF